MLIEFYSLLEVLFVLLPVLLCVAYITIIDSKVFRSMLHRVGFNVQLVGRTPRYNLQLILDTNLSKKHILNPSLVLTLVLGILLFIILVGTLY